MAGRKKKSLVLPRLDKFKIIYGIKSVFRKIPMIIWGGFAVFGIFVFGLLAGFAISDLPEEEASPSLSESKNTQYLEVIDSYQEVSKLYNYQQQDMDIIADYNSWRANIGEVYEAINSYKQKRDEILFQLGRVYELRKKAGLTISNEAQ